VKVWIRVFPTVDTDQCCPQCEPEKAAVLNIHIYPTKDVAEAARSKHGGIVFPVESAQLRGLSENKNQEVALSEYDEREPQNAKSDAWIVCEFGSLPHTWEETEQGELAAFPPETVPWFESLEKETGFTFSQ